MHARICSVSAFFGLAASVGAVSEVLLQGANSALVLDDGESSSMTVDTAWLKSILRRLESQEEGNSQHVFSANGAPSGQTVGDPYQVFKFNEASFNHGNITYDATTGEFTVPKEGIYMVGCRVNILEYPSNWKFLQLTKNNKNYGHSLDGQLYGNRGDMKIHVPMKLLPGDTVSCQAMCRQATSPCVTDNDGYLWAAYLDQGLGASFMAMGRPGGPTLTTSHQVMNTRAAHNDANNWESVEWNNGDGFNEAANKFTAPEGGLYLTGYMINIVATSSNVYCYMAKNGNLYGQLRTFTLAPNRKDYHQTALMRLNKGDSLDTRCYTNSGTVGVDNRGNFWAHKLNHMHPHFQASTSPGKPLAVSPNYNTYTFNPDFAYGGDFETEEADTYTVPSDGVYLVGFDVNIVACSPWNQVHLFKNGSPVPGVLDYKTNPRRQNYKAVAPLDLKAGDKLSVRGRTGASSPCAGDNNAYFWAYKL